MRKFLFLFILYPMALYSQEYSNADCKGNCKNGYGTLEFHSGQFAGDKYMGNFQNGQFHGKGEYYYAKDKATYTGNFINGSCEDTQATYENITYKYIGGYKNNRQNGHATIEFKSGKRAGCKYVGNIADNKMQDNNGTYTYPLDHPDRKIYAGSFENNKFNGYGVLTYKNGSKDDGLWKDDVFQGTKIGVYKNKDVLKKGDTIVTCENRYLLSKQRRLDNKNNYGDYHAMPGLGDGIVSEDGWYVEHDLAGSDNVIGYVTTESKISNPGLINSAANFAKESKGHKFFAIECNKDIYDKFIAFCDWQICKMENSMNVNLIISDELEQKNQEYAELYAIIARQKALDIVVNIGSDATDFLWNNKYLKKLKAGGGAVYILGQNISARTTLNEYITLLITDALTYPMSVSEQSIGDFTFKDIKDCLLQSNIVKIEGGDKALTGFINDSDRTKQLEKELETKIAIFFKQGRDIIDKCIPNDVKFKSKQAYLYYAVAKNLPEYGEMLGLMAASIKLTFFNSEQTDTYKKFVEKCRRKKQFLEDCKIRYATLIDKNRKNCFAQLQAIAELKREAFTVSGEEEYKKEILQLLQKHVFGNEQIGVCNPLDANELRGNNSIQPQTQPEQSKTNYVAIALLDPDGANGFGHTGLILYDKESGFLYYSHAREESSDKYYNATKYLNCQEIIDELNKYNNYSQTFYVSITQEQFKKMKDAASLSVNEKYDEFKNSCLGLLVDALNAGGYKTGFSNPIPRMRFSTLKENANGVLININQICDFTKGKTQSPATSFPSLNNKKQ